MLVSVFHLSSLRLSTEFVTIAQLYSSNFTRQVKEASHHLIQIDSI